MASKIVLVSMALMVAVASAAVAPQAGGGWGPQGGVAPWGAAAGANPWIPPWIASAPWMPKWVACDQLAQPTPICQDCTTRLVCTKVGGLVRPCTDPTLPHCNLGECSATPSAECAPAQPAAAQATVV